MRMEGGSPWSGSDVWGPIQVYSHTEFGDLDSMLRW